VFETLGDMNAPDYLHRAELRRHGYTRVMIDAAVESGHLHRARRDHYLPGDTPDEIVRAVRIGGRLTCLSLLSALGVYVLHTRQLHVHIAPTGSRLRSPHDRRRRLEPRTARGVRLHWLPLLTAPGQSSVVSVADAVAHSIICQPPRAVIATLDSVLYLKLLSRRQLAAVFRSLPRRYAFLERMVDERAESGPESLMRLMLRGLGCDVQIQVEIDGVGRVDLVVDGWLIIECDSRAHHSGWEQQERDRRRDLAAAALGFTTIRPSAKMIADEAEMVLAGVRGLLAAR
jgi:very-short-patch-repair endonuclease